MFAYKYVEVCIMRMHTSLIFRAGVGERMACRFWEGFWGEREAGGQEDLKLFRENCTISLTAIALVPKSIPISEKVQFCHQPCILVQAKRWILLHSQFN